MRVSLSPFDAKDAVLVDLQALVLRHAAEDDVVILRAGEVLQGGAERFRRHDAQIDLQAVAGADRHLRVAAGDAPGPLRRISPRRSIAGVRIVGVDENVEIADRLFAAAIAARELDLVDRLRSRTDARAAPARSGRPRPSTCRTLACSATLIPCRMICSVLSPKPLSLLHLPRFAGGFELVERFDAQFLVQRGRFLRPDARECAREPARCRAPALSAPRAAAACRSARAS